MRRSVTDRATRFGYGQSLQDQDRENAAQDQELREDLAQVRANYARLRSVVQMSDLHASKDLVTDFENLNSTISEVCDTITDSIITWGDPKKVLISQIAR